MCCDDSIVVLMEVKLLLQVDRKDDFHAVVGKPFAEFIANYKENDLRVRNILKIINVINLYVTVMCC